MHVGYISQISAKFCQISKIKVSMESQDNLPNVLTYSRSSEGAWGLKKRPKVSHRGWRPQNSTPQKLERGAPGRPDILVLIHTYQLNQLTTWSTKYMHHIRWTFSSYPSMPEVSYCTLKQFRTCLKTFAQIWVAERVILEICSSYITVKIEIFYKLWLKKRTSYFKANHIPANRVKTNRKKWRTETTEW